MLTDFTQDELLHEILVMPRRSFVPLPDTQVIERPGWLQLLTPSLRQGGLNEVAHSILPAAEADAIIDQTIAQYRDHGIRFRWQVGPDSAPPDLESRLARRGLLPSDACGMARTTAPVPANDQDDILVEQVGPDTLDEFTLTMAQGWDMDPAPLTALHELLLGREDYPLFLARERASGRPIGTAASVLFPRSVYLIGAVVLPASRGRGTYRALVSARLQHAAARGVPLATCQARAETSAPILTRLGFATFCRFRFYLYNPPS